MMQFLSVPIILVLICSVVIAVCGLLNALKKGNKDKRQRLIGIFTFVGAIGVVFGTAWSEINTSKSKKVLRTSVSEIAGEITERDSVPILRFGFPLDSNQIMISLHNIGEFTIYDIRLRIVDLTLYNQLEWKVPMPSSEIKKAESYIYVGTIGPNRIAHLTTFQTNPQLKSHGYNIWISTRHNNYVQEARFVRRENGRWTVATRAFRTTAEGKELIHERMPDIYLRNSNGEVDW